MLLCVTNCYGDVKEGGDVCTGALEAAAPDYCAFNTHTHSHAIIISSCAGISVRVACWRSAFVTGKKKNNSQVKQQFLNWKLR